MVAEIQTPALILFGEGSLARIGEALQKIGVSRPLVVTDRGLVSTPVFEALRSALSSAGIEFGVFSDTVPDPDMTAVEAGARPFRPARMTASSVLAAAAPWTPPRPST